MICPILLAAGTGSRFGGPQHKLLADLDGRPVFAHALDAMFAADVGPPIVVTGAADITALLGERASSAGVVVAHNPHYATGQVSSLLRGVVAASELGARAVVVGLADQPGVTPSAWRAVAAHRGPIAVATYGTKRRNPVLLDRRVWPLLPRSGDEGARVVLRGRPELVHPIACEGLADDIDTVEDLRRWS